MEQILNTENELDIKLFDEVVLSSNKPSSPNKKEAEDVLFRFKNLSNAWTKVDFILKHSQIQESHYVALQILEDTVKTKWYIFDDNIRQGVREYVFQLVIEKSKDTTCKNYVIQELNRIIVEMAKRDWPKRWSIFVPDLINVSTSISMDVCKNTLEILRKLNDDIFIKSDDNITTARRRLLRNQMQTEFPKIFSFIKMILEYSKHNNIEDGLIESTLLAFSCFCASMPLEFIFSTDIVDYVLEYLNTSHSVTCIGCLIEVVETSIDKSKETANEQLRAEKENKIFMIFNTVTDFFSLYLSKFTENKIFDVYSYIEGPEKNFIFKLSQFFSITLEAYCFSLESRGLEKVKKCISNLILITRINDSNLFSVLFDMWSKFIYDLYLEFPFNDRTTAKRLRRFYYENILENLLDALVDKMPRPEEVFILVNEYGEIVKNRLVETDQIEFYKKMRSSMFYLSFLIENKLKKYFIKKVSLQLNDKEWSWSNINKLCWSIGCTSGAFEIDSEKEFFITILKYLLSLCEIKILKADKAVIASNIMFIIGQFSRFLVNNKRFLNTVVKKLFEFMDEEHEGIKDMACDNFFRIAERCPREFLIQREANEILLVYILNRLKEITKTLELYQKRSVYESLLLVIKEGLSALSQATIISYVGTLMSSISSINIFSEQYIGNIKNIISSNEVAKNISHVIKSHTLVYKFVPNVIEPSYDAFFNYYYQIFTICNVVILENDNANSVSNCKTIKVDIINLFTTVVNSRFSNERFTTQICENVLFDYKNNSRYKEPVLIELATALVKKMDKKSVQYFQIESFMISTIIESSSSVLLKADEHPEIAINTLRLIEAFLNESFNSFFPNIYNHL